MGPPFLCVSAGTLTPVHTLLGGPQETPDGTCPAQVHHEVPQLPEELLLQLK